MRHVRFFLGVVLASEAVWYSLKVTNVWLQTRVSKDYYRQSINRRAGRPAGIPVVVASDLYQFDNDTEGLRVGNADLFWQPVTQNVQGAYSAISEMHNHTHAHNHFKCKDIHPIGTTAPRWVCNVHTLLYDPKCIVYSFESEVGDDFADMLSSILDKRCKVYVFGRSSTRKILSWVSNENVVHRQWCLAGTEHEYNEYEALDVPDCEIKTIPQIRRSLGHMKERISLMRFDCNGCEW
jgi:Methyltransferase domain